MRIFITNDDGYKANGIHTLIRIMRQFGDVVAVAPKEHQSGMSMAVTMNFNAIRYKKLYEEPAVKDAEGKVVKGSLLVGHLEATPASCAKFAINNVYTDDCPPDVIVSGINHGSNAASAVCYSGTLGAAAEGALNGIPSIGVSLNSMSLKADFSAVEKWFPDIFRKIMANLPERRGVYYNVNFPKIPMADIRGIRTCYQGKTHWIKEFSPWNPEVFKQLNIPVEELGVDLNPVAAEGEELYMLAGRYVDDPGNDSRADHVAVDEGYISVTAHNTDSTDYAELERIREMDLDAEF
ncbi:MAG: 5'/3'-nucleotidase SurE [Bacteroidales bacterium]|nr:5'/3'-nucleotidase SurE [Bacteroidales bacterium]